MDQRERTDSNTAHDLAEEDLTQAVLASFAHSKSERFQAVVQSLVRHLHAFVSEVQLTEEEWFKGIDFLTRTGHITDDKRQEFILLSDVLGVSMQVIGINNKKPTGATESTLFGPFFVEHSPRYANGDNIANGAPGEPCFLHGRVLALTGEPIPDAHIEVWQSDSHGFYDVQYEGLSQARGRGHLYSDEQGRYSFWSVKSVAYPIPDDGPVGDLLDAANRRPMRPAHVHFMVKAPGYKTLITHLFEEGDPHLNSDAVFAVKSSLITHFERHEPGPGWREDGGALLHHELRLRTGPGRGEGPLQLVKLHCKFWNEAALAWGQIRLGDGPSGDHHLWPFGLECRGEELENKLRRVE